MSKPVSPEKPGAGRAGRDLAGKSWGEACWGDGRGKAINMTDGDP